MKKTIFYNVRDGYGLFFKSFLLAFRSGFVLKTRFDLPLRSGFPSLLSGTGSSHFFRFLFIDFKGIQECFAISLERKVTIPIVIGTRLLNICSDSLNKSLTLNPSRGNVSALFKVAATLLRIACAVLFERKQNKIYLTLLSNLQRPDGLGDFAGVFCNVDLQGGDLDGERDFQVSISTIGNGFSSASYSALVPIIIGTEMKERVEAFAFKACLSGRQASGAAESFWLLFAEKSNKPSRRRMRRTNCDFNNDSNGLASYLRLWFLGWRSLPTGQAGFLPAVVWMTRLGWVGVGAWVKALWSGYKDRQRYRKEVQRRLLKQRALKKERASTPLSLTGEHWTDRFLKKIGFSGSFRQGLLTNRSPRRPNPVANAPLLAMTRCDGYVTSGFDRLKVGQAMTRNDGYVTSGFDRLKNGQAMTHCDLFAGDVRQWFIPRGFLVALGMTCFMSVLFINTVKAQDTLRPLKVGDRVPEVVLSNLLGFTQKEVKFSALRGKVVLIDFWSNYCGSCIGHMPHLQSLKNQLKDSLVVLPVNAAQKEKIAKLWSVNPTLKKIPIYSVYGDTVLSQLFPHAFFPHLVWIDRKGIYLGASSAEYAQLEVVRRLYDGGGVNWQEKMDVDLFDPQVVSLHAYLQQDTSKYFFPYMPNLGSQGRMILQADSTLRYYVVNTQMANLYASAIAKGYQGLPYEPKRRIVALQEPMAYEYDPRYGLSEEWKTKYAFSYERIFPKGTDEVQMQLLLLKDLNVHFGVEGKIIEKEMPVLALRKIAEGAGAMVAEGKKTKLKFWIAGVNKIPGLAWVVNETGFEEGEFLMPVLPENPSLESIKYTIEKMGLALIPRVKAIPMFYLK